MPQQVPLHFSTYDGATNCVTALDTGRGTTYLGLHQGQVFLSESGRKTCLDECFHLKSDQKYLATAVLIKPRPGSDVIYSFVGCKYGLFKVWRNAVELNLPVHTSSGGGAGRPRAFLAHCSFVPALSTEEMDVFRLAFGIGLNHLKLFQLTCIRAQNGGDGSSDMLLHWDQIGLVKSNTSITSAGFDEMALNLVTFSGPRDAPVARMHAITLTTATAEHDGKLATFAFQREYAASSHQSLLLTELGGWMGDQRLAVELIKRDGAMRASKHWNDSLHQYRMLFPAWLLNSTEFEGEEAAPSSSSLSHQQSYYGEQLDASTQVVYKGWWRAHKWEGDGLLFDLTLRRILFKGQFANGMRHGPGKEYLVDQWTDFQGQFVENERHGFGMFTCVKERAANNSVGHIAHLFGMGEDYHPVGAQLAGFFQRGKLHGIARFQISSHAGFFARYRDDALEYKLASWNDLLETVNSAHQAVGRGISQRNCWACGGGGEAADLYTCPSCGLVVHVGNGEGVASTCHGGMRDAMCPFSSCQAKQLLRLCIVGGNNNNNNKRMRRDVMAEARLAFEALHEACYADFDALQCEFQQAQARWEAEVSARLRLDNAALEEDFLNKVRNPAAFRAEELGELAKLEEARRDRFALHLMDDATKLSRAEELERTLGEIKAHFLA